MLIRSLATGSEIHNFLLPDCRAVPGEALSLHRANFANESLVAKFFDRRSAPRPPIRERIAVATRGFAKTRPPIAGVPRECASVERVAGEVPSTQQGASTNLGPMKAAQTTANWRRAAHAAGLSLGLHLVAGLAMWLVLRHGLETNSDLTSRLRFVVEHEWLWMTAWLSWYLAALSFLYFIVSLAYAHETHDSLAVVPLRIAVLLAAAGIVPDLSAEAIEMGVLPKVAAAALDSAAVAGDLPERASDFLTLHRVAVMLTGFLANGLYSLAASILTWTARTQYPRWVTVAGIGVGLAGAWLSAAALVDSPRGMMWSNVVLVPCILAWLTGVAITAQRRSEV